jgi:hypothetical protein
MIIIFSVEGGVLVNSETLLVTDSLSDRLYESQD